jgi:MFS family permease
MTAAYSYGTNEMAREKNKYIGYLETSMGFGNTFGPVLGGFAYGYFGFVGTFLFFSALITVGML